MPPTPPPFDPELAAVLDVMKEFLTPGLALDEIDGLRNGPAAAALAEIDLTMDGAFDVESRTVPGPKDAPAVSLLICRPTTPAPAQPRPLLYYVHGGGMVIGDYRSGMPVPLAWAKELDAVVVSVDYRLAPEHRYPAQIEDVYAGLVWTADHAAELGADTGRIVISGTSAGGGLAAALALLTRDRQGPHVIGQLLMCPMLDDRNDTPSAHQMTGVGIWDRTANETGWTALLGPARGGPDVSPYAAPARAEDLTGLPPTFLDVASAETFRDEVVTYASRIWQAGGTAELHVWPGGFHSFAGFAPQAQLSRSALAAQLNWLRRLLGDSRG
ncbi:alpha/beta hydrolase [Streptomyces sp. NPDC126522]|uniref:alpha/beta hydrolase n=1 Tax=Streptomyces sp. NPDC126522 TaxID=3155211 RepID=UPI003329D94B